jgi:hypothetical protein
MIKKRLLTIFLICFANSLFAQNYEKEFETIFAWEVKQVDEFMERFNNKDNTLIKNYKKDGNDAKSFNRERMIKSLFDAQTKSWNFEEINSFIREVSSKSLLLDFYDRDWYAKVNCSVTWKGSPQKAIIILKLQVNSDSSSKWVISGVSAPFLSNTTFTELDAQKSKDKSLSLNPVSHATDFMNLYKITENGENISNYFSPIEEQNKETKIFMQQCILQNLKIKNVANISYHFLQLNNWIFEVKQLNRQTKNSGWLITKLIKVNTQEKNLYRLNTLKQQSY